MAAPSTRGPVNPKRVRASWAGDERRAHRWLGPAREACLAPPLRDRPVVGRAPSTTPVPRHTRPAGRRTAWATSLVGAGAVAALVTGGSHAGLPQPAGGSTGRGLASPLHPVDRPPGRRVASSSSSSYGCGVVVATGGLIATNATLLADAEWIIATTSTGRREVATVVAVDPASDVGLVRIATTLPVARFVDWSDVQPGADAVEMAVSSAVGRHHDNGLVERRRSRRPATRWDRGRAPGWSAWWRACRSATTPTARC